MKLTDGTLEFENQTCCFCNGTKEVTRFILCPNNHKAVGVGKKCAHCGSKNKYSHKAIGSKVIPCDMCDATGIKMETKYDYLPKEIFTALPVKLSLNTPHRGHGGQVGESLFGLGLVGGATDYGRMKKFYETNGEYLTIRTIQEEYSSRQAIQFYNKENKFATGLEIVLREYDYSVYPIWE